MTVLSMFRAASLATMTTLRPIVLTGPSGTGKSTILNRAMCDYPDAFAFSVSHTTRLPRPGEVHGVHYHFIDRDRMEAMIRNDEFIEFAQFGGNMYGTSKQAVEEIAKTGRICILDVELTGVRNLKKQELNAKFILIRAPSLDVVEDRLRKRGTETEETIRHRLKHARDDDTAAQQEPHLFDKVIINDKLDDAYKEFMFAIKDELDAIHEHHSNGHVV